MKINSDIVSKLYPTITSSLLIKKIFRQKSEMLRILYDKKKTQIDNRNPNHGKQCCVLEGSCEDQNNAQFLQTNIIIARSVYIT